MGAIADVPIGALSQLSLRFQLDRCEVRQGSLVYSPSVKWSGGGDLIFGITKVRPGMTNVFLQQALDTGYSYIMGREMAPESMFYGGRSRRCCDALGTGSGPR